MSGSMGPFTLTKFFGASVMNYSSSIGWNEQSTTVTINLVEDVRGGDRWSPLAVGEPCVLTYEGFSFDGILQRYLQRGDFNGNPTYEVTLMSPTEILAGAQVILASYNGHTNLMPNLINVYGYWESILGFGGAMVNASGMLWQAPFNIIGLSPTGGGININQVGTVGIKPAVELLTASGDGFGRPIQFRGHYYNVDLSALPLPPSYYRLGGVSRSILEMVSEICQDGGYDYIVYLDGHTIRFKTVSRLNQPAIGQIGNFVNSRTDVTSKSVGVELRNDVTNAILLGGDYRTLALVQNPAADNTIWPYWGIDADGKPIMGQGQPEVSHTFDLNATDIADIIGQTTYPCSIPELRLAASDAGFDSWAAWVIRFEPDKADTIPLVGAIDSTSDLATIFGPDLFQRDTIAADPLTTFYMGGMNAADYFTRRAQRVFEFVRRYATEYFGRKFLVRIPFQIYWKVEPETTNVIKSDEPADDGGYIAEGSQPLGLSYINEDFFLSDDGKMQCFAVFPPDNTIDTQKMSPENYVVQSNGIFVAARIDTSVGIVYPAGTIYPYCVIELSDPVQQLAPDPLGGISDLAAVLGYDDPTQILNVVNYRHGDFPLRIIPPYYRPSAVAVPMKSNRNSYGPWGTFSPWGQTGLPGKVYFDRDESLVPWEYGDINTMNLAASARLANTATNMQESETGHVEVAGFPTASLGDSLVSGGPNITSITVSAGVNGVTTTYEMKTFTRQFAAFAKENADRLKRLGIAAQQTRRSIRALYLQSQQSAQIGYRAQMGFMENTSRAVRQMTPHDVLYGRMTKSEAFGYRTQCSTATYPEALANSRGDQDEKWQLTAAMSMEGLLRPFSTNYANPGPSPGAGDIPHYGKTVTEMSSTESAIACRKTLDPFGDYNDVDIMAWNTTYPGDMHTIKAAAISQADPDSVVVAPAYDNARLLGLRGPIVMVGWGYDYTGKPIPNAASTDAGGNTLPIDQWATAFLDKHRSHPEKWVAGPLDLHYDTWRNVWTIPTFLKGTLLDTITGGPGRVSIDVNGTTLKDKVTAYNWLGGTINANTKVIVGYYPLENKWYIMVVGCTTS